MSEMQESEMVNQDPYQQKMIELLQELVSNAMEPLIESEDSADKEKAYELREMFEFFIGYYQIATEAMRTAQGLQFLANIRVRQG